MFIGHDDGDGAVVGQFHVGRHKDGKPVAASSWRVTTRMQHVADALVGYYENSILAGKAKDGRAAEVVTGCDRVPILLVGQRAVTLRMMLKGAGEVFHSCDGYRFLDPAPQYGEPCGCPSTLGERKSAAATGRGPVPETRIRFRLAELPNIGMFVLNSSSWAFAEEVPQLTHALGTVSEPVRCVLRYDMVEFTTRSGVDVSYRRPIVELAGMHFGGESVELAA
ncbi:hypothetical protein [Streptomyces sp. NPDC059010]|uniref:recombination directionality factor n=1 Tax=Streptomyces sp. NPDC059010 TaxID=3346695 RepID=UPI003692C676